MGHNLNPSQYQKKVGVTERRTSLVLIAQTFESHQSLSYAKQNTNFDFHFAVRRSFSFVNIWSIIVVQVLSSTIYYSFQQRGETWLTDETASHSTRSHFSQLYYKINIIFSSYVVQLLSEERKEDSLNLGLGISVHSSVFRYILWFS